MGPSTNKFLLFKLKLKKNFETTQKLDRSSRNNELRSIIRRKFSKKLPLKILAEKILYLKMASRSPSVFIAYHRLSRFGCLERVCRYQQFNQSLK